MDQGPSRRQPERRRLSALSPADHRRRQVDGNIERRDSRALPSGLLRCVAYRAGSGGAAGAGARGLNLSEAKGRDVCAAPTLPVWPGPHPHALDDDCRRQAHRTRGQPRAFEQGLISWRRRETGALMLFTTLDRRIDLASAARLITECRVCIPGRRVYHQCSMEMQPCPSRSTISL